MCNVRRRCREEVLQVLDNPELLDLDGIAALTGWYTSLSALPVWILHYQITVRLVIMGTVGFDFDTPWMTCTAGSHFSDKSTLVAGKCCSLVGSSESCIEESASFYPIICYLFRRYLSLLR